MSISYYTCIHIVVVSLSLSIYIYIYIYISLYIHMDSFCSVLLLVCPRRLVVGRLLLLRLRYSADRLLRGVRPVHIPIGATRKRGGVINLCLCLLYFVCVLFVICVCVLFVSYLFKQTKQHFPQFPLYKHICSCSGQWWFSLNNLFITIEGQLGQIQTVGLLPPLLVLGASLWTWDFPAPSLKTLLE